MKTSIQKIDDFLTRKSVTFWYEDKNGKYRFSLPNCIKYLETIGVARHYVNETGFIYVHVENNIGREIDIASVKHLILEYVDSFKNKNLNDSAMYFVTKSLNRSSLENLQRKDIKVFKGEKEKVYLFFKDKIAVISKDSISTMEYDDFHHTIWQSDIMNRNFPDVEMNSVTEDGVFEKFFHNVFGSTPQGKQFAMQVIGYALQRYRDLSNMRAIILNDSGMDDAARGGTGKGLIYQALSKFQPSVIENGKAYRADRPFTFQNINIDTRLCFIDDVTPRFDITDLFSVITDGLYVEKKHKQPFKINPENAPLFILSTNYGLKGSDESHLRRRYDLGLDKYYGADKTPRDEFGHQFFNDWDVCPEQWMKFDFFMMKCVQKYLSVNRLKPWHNPAIALKQLRADTHSEFPEIAKDFPLDRDISKDQELARIRIKLGLNKLTKSLLTRWTKKYCIYAGLEYSTDRNKDTFLLKDPNKL